MGSDMQKMKGYGVQSLAVLAVLFVVASVTISMGAEILSGIDDEQTEDTYEDNITEEGLSGLDTMGGWLPTIAIVVMAAVVIGVLLTSFKFGKG